MDPDKVLAPSRQPRADDVTRNLLTRMADRYKMASEWIRELSKLQGYYRNEREKYKNLGGIVGASPQSSNSDGGGGGLKDYALHFEKAHKSFGVIRDTENDEWDDEDIDQDDYKLPRDAGLDERGEFMRAGKMEKEDSSTMKSPGSVPKTSEFTPVNTKQQVEIEPHSGHGAHMSTHHLLPVHGPQYSAGQPGLAPTYMSPTTSYRTNGTAYSQNGMPTERDTHGPNRGQSHIPDREAVYGDANYGTWQAQSPGEEKQRMEKMGLNSLQNHATFDNIMMGDGFNGNPSFGFVFPFANDPADMSYNQTNTWYPQDTDLTSYQYNTGS